MITLLSCPTPLMTPRLTSESTVALLAVPVREVPRTTTLSAVDELFRHDPLLRSVAVVFEDGPELLTRTSYQQLLIGPLGYGRAVNSRQPLWHLVDRGALLLAFDTPLSTAAQLLVDRPPERRYDDVLVSGPAGLGLLTVSAVFERLSQHFAHQSVHDPLTGLPNRLLLADSVRKLPVRGVPAAVADVVTSPALLYVDLDGFKAVNDEHGHDVGDTVLLQFAQRLREAVRPGDLVARLGGDEFAVLLVAPVTPAQAHVVADRLVLLAATPFFVGSVVIQVGASVGIAHAEVAGKPEPDAVDVLLRSADAAMYRAKSGGRGRVEWHPRDDAAAL